MGSFPIPTQGRVTLGDRLKTAWMRNTLKFVLPGVEDSFKRERGVSEGAGEAQLG